MAAAQLLDSLVRRPGQLDGEVVAAALVDGGTGGMQADARGRGVTDDGHQLGTAQEGVLLTNWNTWDKIGGSGCDDAVVVQVTKKMTERGEWRDSSKIDRSSCRSDSGWLEKTQ